jgi:hypothetical protein
MAKPIVDLGHLGVTQDMLDELDRSIQIAYSNVRDPKVMRRAAERMDQMREEAFRGKPPVDLAVPLVRESRDEL